MEKGGGPTSYKRKHSNQPLPAVPTGTPSPQPMQVFMEDICVDIEGDESEVCEAAFQHAASYHAILARSPADETAPPPTVEQLRDIFRAACIEFSRGSQIQAAHEAASQTPFDFEVLQHQHREFLSCAGDLEQFARQIQTLNAPHRFNAERLAPFEELIDPVDYARLFDIATVGVHIPIPDNFRAAPPNPQQRSLAYTAVGQHPSASLYARPAKGQLHRH